MIPHEGPHFNPIAGCYTVYGDFTITVQHLWIFWFVMIFPIFEKYYCKMSITIKQNKNIRIDSRSQTHSCTGSKTVYFLVIPRESIECCSNIPALASYLNTSQAVFTHIPSRPRSLSALCKLLGSLCSQCSCLERHMEGRIASGVLTASAKNLLIILPIQQVAWPGLDQWVWTTILPHTTEAR